MQNEGISTGLYTPTIIPFGYSYTKTPPPNADKPQQAATTLLTAGSGTHAATVPAAAKAVEE